MSQDTRKDRRAKIVSLNVRYKSATVDEFIENHSHDVSKGGLFIKTPTPFPPGTLLKFEIRIASDKAVIAGVGRVVWKREPTQSGGERPAGMGVKFIKVDDTSRATIDRLVGTKEGAGAAFTAEPSAEVNDKNDPNRPALVRRGTMMGLGEGSQFPPPVEGSPSAPPPRASAHPAPAAPKAGGMFASAIAAAPPEAPVTEPTMMKQARELLEEALKEAGGSMEEIGDNPLFHAAATAAASDAKPGSIAPAAGSKSTAPSASASSSAASSAPAPVSGSTPPKAVSGTLIGMSPADIHEMPTRISTAPTGSRSSRPPPLPPETAGAASSPPPAAVAAAAGAVAKAESVPPPSKEGSKTSTRPGAMTTASTAKPAVAKAAPVNARALASAPETKSGGGLVWGLLGLVVVGGGIAAYKAGVFGGSDDATPAPSATAVTTSTSTASTAPTSSATAMTASTSATSAMTANPNATSTSTSTATSTATATATATAIPTAKATTTPTATSASTATVATGGKRHPHKPVDDQPAATGTVLEESSGTPTSTAATAAPTASPTTTATASAAPTPPSTATVAPTATGTATATPTATAAPTVTSTATPTATAAPTAAPTAPTPPRTTATAAPTAAAPAGTSDLK